MDSSRFIDSPGLRRIINRHSKEDLIDIAITWSSTEPIARPEVADTVDATRSQAALSDSEYKKHVQQVYRDFGDKANKKKVIDRMLGVDWIDGLTNDQVAELDLAYKEPKVNVNPVKIQKALSHHLAPYFRHHVGASYDNDKIWIRISVLDGLAPNTMPQPSTIAYFIWFCSSDYLLHAGVKAEWREFILEAFVRLFKAAKIEEWPLTGKSPTSLAELLLNRDSQGQFSRYRLGQVDDNPLLHAPTKRKAPTVSDNFSRGMDDIEPENIHQIVMRENQVAQEFGPNTQPALPKVSIRLDLPYTANSKDYALGRLTKRVFPVGVVLEGSNVIEGIKELVPLGIAEDPLPSFLTTRTSPRPTTPPSTPAPDTTTETIAPVDMIAQAGGSNTLVTSPETISVSSTFLTPERAVPAGDRGDMRLLSSSPARSLAAVMESIMGDENSISGSQSDTGASVGAGTGGQRIEWAPSSYQSSHFHQQQHFGRPLRGTAGQIHGAGAGLFPSSLAESRMSEFEVVYDDGVRKQRTFSLTTDPGGSDAESFSSETEGESDDENMPLLDESTIEYNRNEFAQFGGQYGSLPADLHVTHNLSSGPPPITVHARRRQAPRLSSFVPEAVRARWRQIRQYQFTLIQKRVLKASLAYLLGCLISFIPLFHPYVGLSAHLAATCAVFFNPAKTLGRMVDAVRTALISITFSVFVCIASLASAVWFNSRDHYILGHVTSLLIFGGGSTFIVALAKAHFNTPTVSSACSMANIMIFVVLTREGALYLDKFSYGRVVTITTAMLLGVIISTLVCVLVWPESAHDKLRQDIGQSLTAMRLLLKLLTKTFLLESDMTPFRSASVQKLIEAHVKSFSALAKSLEEAELEFAERDMDAYKSCVKSLNTLAQYLNGLRSSCGLQFDMLQRQEKRKGVALNSAAAEGSQSRKPKVPRRMSSYSIIGSMQADQEYGASADLLEFLDLVGRPMKSLALTSKITIEHMQDIFCDTHSGKQGLVPLSPSRPTFQQRAFNGSGEPRPSDTENRRPSSTFTPRAFKSHSLQFPEFHVMQENLGKALDIFENANSRALKKFYSYQTSRRASQRLSKGARHMSEPSLAAMVQDYADENPGTLGQQLEDDAPVSEQIFLVYFFVFNLMEFAKELSSFVGWVDILVGGDEGLRPWMIRTRMSWWRRLLFFLTGYPKSLRPPQRTTRTTNEVPDEIITGSPPSSNDIQSTMSRSSTTTPVGSVSQRKKDKKAPLFPKPNRHNVVNTLHTPAPKTFMQRASTRIWKFLHVFRSFKFKFAVKAACSAVLLMTPAFVDWTRPYFVQYRGEWAVISMTIVMVPTVGGTNIVGLYRILGTIIGCYMGVATYTLFPGNTFVLPICCFLWALPNFQLVLASAYPRMGQISLLAFNLVLLQSYNRQRQDGTVPPDDDEDDDDDDMADPLKKLVRFLWESTPSSASLSPPHVASPYASTVVDDDPHFKEVWNIAFHRAVAVSFGVLLGVAITNYVWPYEARVELRKGLSDLLVNISWLYNKIVAVYSTNLDRMPSAPANLHAEEQSTRYRSLLVNRYDRDDEGAASAAAGGVLTGSRRHGIENMNKEFMEIELSLQMQLLRLYELLAETPNEPRLKGRFPVATYRKMLAGCQNILDRFLSMRLVITQDRWVESARRDFIVPVNRERREMVGNVLLYFYTLASALRLKTPLPPYLPPANQARLRLIRKIRQLPVVQNKAVLTAEDDVRYIFYYAYALVMEDVIRELERLGEWSQELFGVITPVDDFNSWFLDEEVWTPSIHGDQAPFWAGGSGGANSAVEGSGNGDGSVLSSSVATGLPSRPSLSSLRSSYRGESGSDPTRPIVEQLPRNARLS
ncbi:hypothetical protein DFQ26_007622 [Actinomortierella ambigua]|nr:hypothetical protein DFQ26_007622 [Actinomortierella ambigua]